MPRISEERVERWVENQTNSLDRRYLLAGDGRLSEADYRLGCRIIDRAADDAREALLDAAGAALLDRAQDRLWELGRAP